MHPVPPPSAYQLYHALQTGNQRMVQLMSRRFLQQTAEAEEKKWVMLLQGILSGPKDPFGDHSAQHRVIQYLEQRYPLLAARKKAILTYPIAEGTSPYSPAGQSLTSIRRLDVSTKVLVLCANPDDQYSLRTDHEIRDIQEGLNRVTGGGAIQLIPRLAVRLADLRTALLETTPAVVHFAGHGCQEGIYLESERGLSSLVSAEALGRLLAVFSDHLQMVVLNCCYSWQPAQEIARYIPRVIAMRGVTSDQSARPFARAFYEALASGCSWDTAFDYARAALQLEGFDSNLAQMVKKTSEIR
ncbi:MAG: CHAT domain-containing protein [Haliscomenobacter sp.]